MRQLPRGNTTGNKGTLSGTDIIVSHNHSKVVKFKSNNQRLVHRCVIRQRAGHKGLSLSSSDTLEHIQPSTKLPVNQNMYKTVPVRAYNACLHTCV